MPTITWARDIWWADHVYPPGQALSPEDNILAQFACMGRPVGKFFRGRAAERFGVRNSGARAVVEGVGDHGCEYMTGGRVVVLGPTGRNFAAGMSGGVAYVWDRQGDFEIRCNLEMVELERIDSTEEELEVRDLISRHADYTRSGPARQALEDWPTFLSQCVKVMPTDYKRVLEEQAGLRQPALVTRD